MATAPRALALADGRFQLPVLGLGTWRMGEQARARAGEVQAVRQALEMGYRLFDTAEMYSDGGAETVLGLALGEALRAGDVRRDDITLVSKVYPHNASRQGLLAACSRSRQRLGLDRIDLYLLHWRGQHPLADTVAAFLELQARGAIRHWGVSNFDVDDMQELAGAAAAVSTDPATACVCDQVYLSPTERGPELALLPSLRRQGMGLMAYSPIDQGACARDGKLARIAADLGVSAARLGLAWLLAKPGVSVIPKAVQPAHLRDNLAAATLTLDADVLAALDAAHPLPRHKPPLAMI
ncbi:MAG: hypothetical protein RIQ60_4242 [Pseudomonadota bacterium]|jgi:diketogulonate reductase-like aldo/keto reductase